MTAQTRAVFFKKISPFKGNPFKADLPKINPFKGNFFKSKLFKVLLAAAVVILGLLTALIPTWASTTFTVANASDSGPGSLRQAILDANATPNGILGVDEIRFDIPTTDPGYSSTSGVFTISPTSVLPTITDPVTIDGYTQGDSTPDTADDATENTLPVGNDAVLKIELSGTNAGQFAYGLKIHASDSTVKGLVINRFAQNGIELQFANATGNKIQGNYVGTDATGTVDLGNTYHGVATLNSATNTTIGGMRPGERNVVSGNDQVGLFINYGTDQIQGNYVGTDKSGTKDLGNGGDGLILNGTVNATVGGTSQGAGNLISGNDRQGIDLTLGASGSKVEGNYIGTDVTGTVDLGNTGDGVLLSSSTCCSFNTNNTIGGTTAGARNVISGNNGHGVSIGRGTNASVTNNRVQGNYIGTKANGTQALGNFGNGVIIVSGGNNDNTIGGTTAAEGNVISGNGQNGVSVGNSNGFSTGDATRNKVQGNYIGTNKDGARPTGAPDLGNAQHGVLIDGAPNNTVGGTATGSGNVISDNNRDGISLNGSGATGTQVQGNYIGTDAAGTTRLGNSRIGVYTFDAPSNVVGGTSSATRNVISGNDLVNVFIEGSFIGTNTATGNEMKGNYIGTDKNGTATLGGFVVRGGVYLNNAPNNTIGGTEPGAGNVIAGHGEGVNIGNPRSTGNKVQGNYIGTNVDGTASLANGEGVYITNASDNLVGGADADDGAADGVVKARNVISGNNYNGVLITPNTANGNKVKGNYIGTDAGGTADLGNSYNGVYVHGERNSVIGGTEAGAGNVISGNNGDGVGVVTFASSSTVGTKVQGNYIGTKANGTEALGNSRAGVHLGGGRNNLIGGTGAGEPNVIAFNTGDGVRGSGFTSGGGGTGHAITSNSIFSNGSLGIDLDPDGITPNDAGDGDSGSNNLQNYPVVTKANSSGGTTEIEGTLNSTPSTAFTVQLFSSPEKNPSGNGEGKTYLGETSVTTNGSGNASFTTTETEVPAAEVVTATATSPGNDTSEFSGARDVNIVPDASDDTATTDEDTNTSIDVLSDDTDADGDTLAVAEVSDPANGTATISTDDGSITYTPDENYNNDPANPDTFTYTVSDGNGGTGTATVAVTINPVNDAPVIDLNGGAAGTSYEVTFTEDGGPVAAADSAALAVNDVDNDALASATVQITNLKDGDDESLDADTSVVTATIRKVYDPTTGELRLTGEAPKADYEKVLRTVEYDNSSQDPDTTDRNLTFVINNDGTDSSNTATSTVTVQAVNDAPTVSDIAEQTTNEDTATDDIAFTVGDEETATADLTMTDSSDDQELVPDANIEFGGTGADRTVKVTPASNRSGTANITVTVTDTDGGTASDTFELTVAAVNDTPTVSNITDQTTNEDTATDPIAFMVGDEETAAADLGATGSSDNQDLVPDANIEFGGTGKDRTVKVTPASNKSGSANISVTVTDADGGTASDTFKLAVTAVNDRPAIGSVDADTPVEEGSSSTITVAATDPEDDPLSYEFDCDNASGYDSTPQADSTYECAFDDDGAYTVNVRVTDGKDGQAAGSTEVEVKNVAPTATLRNDGPIDEGSSVTVSFSGPNDASSADEGAGFHYEYRCDGSEFTGTPNYGEASTSASTSCAFDNEGTYTVRARIIDKDDGATEYTSAVRVDNADPGNRAPTVEPDTATTNEDTAVDVAVLANDQDPDGDSLRIAEFTQGTSGEVTLNNGTLKYTPKDNFSGTDTFTYTATDGTETDAAEVQITVNAVNDAPTISAIDNRTIREGFDTGEIPFTVGDVDNAADELTVTGSSSNTNLVPNDANNIAFWTDPTDPTKRTAKVKPEADRIGKATITVKVIDESRGEALETFDLTVVYDFKGFFSPVDNLPTLNLAKAGSAIPVKFGLSGDQGLDIFEPGYPKSQQIDCYSKAPTDAIEVTVSAGSSSLSYDPVTDQYSYVWKTSRSWAGNSCRELTLKLKGGSEHKANFQFK